MFSSAAPLAALNLLRVPSHPEPTIRSRDGFLFLTQPEVSEDNQGDDDDPDDVEDVVHALPPYWTPHTCSLLTSASSADKL